MKSKPLTPTLSPKEREHSRPTLEIGGVSRLTHGCRRHPLSLRERDRVRGNLSDISNLMNNSPDPLTPTLSRRERAHLRPTLEVGGVSRLTHGCRRHPLSLGERARVRAEFAQSEIMKSEIQP